MKNEDTWILLDEENPLAWEKGEWDGNRTDFVLVATDKGKIEIARAYENIIGAIYSLDWYDKNGYDVKGTVTHWQKLPIHPMFKL